MVIAAAYIYLTSRAGGERILHIALASVRNAITGSIDAQQLEFGGNRLVMHNATLRDPDGELVAEAETIEVRLSVFTLIRRTLDIRQLTIARPQLHLRSDERGLNLARAVQPRHPSPPLPSQPESGKTDFGFILENLELLNGELDFEQMSEPSPRVLRLEHLEAQGAVQYATASEKLKADLRLEGRVTRPVQGPLSLKMYAQGAGDHRTGELALLFAGLQVVGSAEAAGDELRAKLARLEISPSLARAWLPAYPLLVPLAVSGEAARHGNVAAAKLDLKAGATTIAVVGSIDLVKLRSDGFTLRARGINLEELIANGPKSELALDVRAQGGGHSLEDIDGALELIAPAARIRDQPIGPIQIEARAHRGTLEISRLVADLPGVRVAGAGSGNASEISFSSTLTATNLKAFSHALGGVLKQLQPLQMAGSGELRLTVRGPIRRPAVTANGSFPELRYETYSIDKLSFAANVPDVQKPLQSQASLSASRIQTGDRVFGNVSANLKTRGRDLAVDLRCAGPAQLTLHAGGVVDADHKGVLLNAFQLGYPEAQWSLQKPARIHFGDGDLSAEPLELRSGSQSIHAAGSLRGERLRAELEVQKVDLSLLPKAVVSPSLRVAGLFSAQVQARGLLPQPTVEARLELQHGRFKRYEELGLSVNASYSKDRVNGSANAQGLGTALRTDFNVPIEALRLRRHEPVHLQATLDDTRIEQVLSSLGRPDPISGIAAAKIVVGGTADNPQMRVAIEARSVRYAQSPRTDISFTTESGDGGKIGASLEWTVAQAKSSVVVRTPLTVARLVQSPPTAESVRTMPIELDMDVHELPLDVLREAGIIHQTLRGKLSVRGQVRGSAAAPSGKIAASLAGGAFGGLPPTDASLIATASPAGIQATMNAQRNDRRLLDLTASVQVPVDKVGSVDDLIDRPLSVKVTLGPLSLEELRAFATASEVAPAKAIAPTTEGIAQPTQPGLGGILHLDLALTGSLADPRVDLRSELSQMTAEKLDLGTIHLEYSYRNTNSALSVEMASTAGALTIKGQSKLDLSYSALRKGLAYSNAPIDVSLHADRLNLAFLSGLTQQVRTISGKLVADASIQGTIGLPKVRGKIEWSEGRLALTGYGEYDNIHLLLEGTEERVKLRELLAHSGGGQVKVTADAQRTGGNLTLTGSANLDKFPIISDDQLVATISMRSTLEGEISPKLVDVRRLDIPEAHIELPDTKRKDLQKLEPPDDIVLLHGGEPLDKKKYREAMAGMRGLGGAGVAEEAPSQAPTRQYSITVDAPRNVWVKGSDLNIEIGLSDGFRVDVAHEPAIFGEVRLLQGRVDVWGRRFDVQKNSTVRFGGPPTQPYLDVTALYNNEREKVKVFITLRGQGKDLSIKTSSEPPLTDTEIYTLIVTGHRTLKTNSGASAPGSSLAVSALGSLAANELKNVLAAKLPLDVLSIEAGESGLSGTKLEAGTYVTDRIYIGYTARINARQERGENANEVRVEYQISPRWSVVAEYGDAKAGGADIVWSRDY